MESHDVFPTDDILQKENEDIYHMEDNSGNLGHFQISGHNSRLGTFGERVL